MFSTQTASTGPSKTIHLWPGPSSDTAPRMSTEATPSRHLLVTALYSPNSSPKLMLLGLRVSVWTDRCLPVEACWLASRHSAPRSMLLH